MRHRSTLGQGFMTPRGTKGFPRVVFRRKPEIRRLLNRLYKTTYSERRVRDTKIYPRRASRARDRRETPSKGGCVPRSALRGWMRATKGLSRVDRWHEGPSEDRLSTSKFPKAELSCAFPPRPRAQLSGVALRGRAWKVAETDLGVFADEG